MKKTTKKVKEKVVEPVVEVPTISLIEHDFGREDLNMLRDKINEIISR